MGKELLNKLKIVKDIDGKHVVVINDVRFKGKTKAEWKLIENVLKEYVGKSYEIAETCERVYIGKDFPDEFTHGKDKTVLKGPNAKAKANASMVIKELVQIGTNKTATKDYGNKHGRLAENGWYRYDTRLAIPIYNDEKVIIKYNIYKLRMLVRHDADGKLYLYDFLHTKKKKKRVARFSQMLTVVKPASSWV